MSLYTVFGGRGFIGSEFVKQLKEQGHEVFVPERNDDNVYTKELGIVIYSAGYGDCQNDPFNVFEANVNLLTRLLQSAKFEKLVYISSTRVYMNQNESCEYSDITICNEDNRRLFNLTKLMAEELCLKSQRNCLIIRPSNVYGLALNSPLFLPSIIRDAINNGRIDMFVRKEYEKDYISVSDVVDSTLKLLSLDVQSKEIINIASGVNVSAEKIAEKIHDGTGCDINWHQIPVNFIVEMFPNTDISNISSMIDFKPRMVLDDLSLMITNYQTKLSRKNG